MPDLFLKLITKVQLSKHHGPAIKNPYLAILINVPNPNLATHPGSF